LGGQRGFPHRAASLGAKRPFGLLGGGSGVARGATRGRGIFGQQEVMGERVDVVRTQLLDRLADGGVPPCPA